MSTTSGPSPTKYRHVEGVNPFVKVEPDTRCLPVFRKSDVATLLDTLVDEENLETNKPFDVTSAMGHGLLFFAFEHETLVVGAPSGLVQEVKGHNLKGYLRKLLADPHVIKVSVFDHKRILENVYRVTVVGHLNLPALQALTKLPFTAQNEVDPKDKDPHEYNVLEAVRKVRTLIATYWEFVYANTIVGKKSATHDVSPWSRLILAQYSDPNGRPSSYTAKLSDKEVVAILDATPYDESGPHTLHVEPHPDVRNLAIAGQNLRIRSMNNDAWRKAVLVKLNMKAGCCYPVCVRDKKVDHLLEQCPVIATKCSHCNHFGHEVDAHLFFDQILLDNFFKVYAPSHVVHGRVWQLAVTRREDWEETYLYGSKWIDRHHLEARVPAPRPPTLSEINIARDRLAIEESQARIIAEQEVVAASLAKQEADRKNAEECQARIQRFQEPVVLARDPELSDAQYLIELAENRRRRREAEEAEDKIAAELTARLKAKINPMPLLSTEVEENFRIAVALNPVHPETTFKSLVETENPEQQVPLQQKVTPVKQPLPPAEQVDIVDEMDGFLNNGEPLVSRNPYISEQSDLSDDDDDDSGKPKADDNPENDKPVAMETTE